MPAAASLSDETLMQQVQAGDLNQLTPLFERYHGPLFGFLARLNNGDRDTAQDLTQNVFLRLLKYRASYQPGLVFRTWLYQLARHVHADHWQRRVPLPTELETLERTAFHGRAAQAQQAAATQCHGVQEALALLPPAQREVLELHRFQGFSYAEIGELLGCTEGAARVKAHRALEALRAIYFH
ncbi:RNA polymerase sigma factor [Hymenobacter puniceus]|uniref:RNA polymerase sigma factor n=1 Tax=Hymenobacter sp. BT190 TaxID=2763505 RepID=UPI00165171E3|nr:RNA polymerase sigma factor [Hymenobacter sp. BT190]MBC6697095.1 RNA polymerase sigma factor [Hymenobacter sp. BT190]